MPLCQSCTYPVNKYVVGCDACDSRAEREFERAARAKRDEWNETLRFRDRCALHYSAIMLSNDAGATLDPSEIAIESYKLADAMLGARSVR